MIEQHNTLNPHPPLSNSTDTTSSWSPPSFASININSLSATKAGGITDRFAKVITLLAYLTSIHLILCVQDIRIPSDNFIKVLTPILPNYSFHTTAGTTTTGGVVTIINNNLFSNYNITSTTIFKGSILASKFTHKTLNKQFTLINTYLHASSESNWLEQVNSINTAALGTNTFLLGDFNHASDAADRSGAHRDKSNFARACFSALLTKHSLQELSQPNHTWYGMKEGRLSSSRIDRIFHNCDFTTLAITAPTANVITAAPNTVTMYGLSSRKRPNTNTGTLNNTNHHTTTHHYHHTTDFEQDLDSADRQLIDSFLPLKEGGSHVTDHLPISVRFSDGLNKAKHKFISHSLQSPAFAPTFHNIWDNSLKSCDPRIQLHSLNKTLCYTSHKVKNTSVPHAPKNTELWEAVRLVDAIDKGTHPDTIKSKFSHIPDYLSLLTDTKQLIKKINNDFASLAFEEDAKVPISKVATLAKTLPNTRQRITALHDATNDCLTSDPNEMTHIANSFWRDKWSKKPVHDPSRLFRIYGKKLSIQPTPITLETVTKAIMSTNNSSPGPNGVPFAAYRAVVRVAATVFLNMIIFLQQGCNPSAGFNAGTLHLLPKKATDRIEDTRPLVVNNCDNRIIATIINDSILPAVESILSDNQNGFRERRNTAINIEFFNEKFYGAMENRSFYDILFIDFLKAFDSVAHAAIFDLLLSVGFSDDYINVIKALFHNAYCLTNFAGATPASIYFDSGVKQGCPLSPTLFILIIDVLVDMLEKAADVDVKFFADDGGVGDANIIPKLPLLKKIFSTFKKFTGLEMNVSKSAMLATGGRTQLRKALDSIGWTQLRISGSERYLGTYLGHLTTMEDIFKIPMQKLHNRCKLFTPIKHHHSLQSRIIIWNTWMLSIFSYVFQFHSIPTDYLETVDRLCVAWLNTANTMKTLYLSRPTKLAGLTTPLRDTTLDNYSKLASFTTTYDRLGKNTTSWSVRIATHRISARNFLKDTYQISIDDAATPASIYRKALLSPAMTNNYHDYLDTKLTKRGVTDTTTYYNNYSKTPSWVPSYVRATHIRILHNALFTAHRLKKTEDCYLCASADGDDIRHIWGSCPVAAAAHNVFWHQLGVNRPFSLTGAICADGPCDAPVVAAQLTLTESIWRARVNAYKSSRLLCINVTDWVVSNALTRIKLSCPSFFNDYFSANSVPLRYKISYGANVGSSSSNNERTRDTAKHVVSKSISNLPHDSYYAFTDGSAVPNPGPTGAGAVIYRRVAHSSNDPVVDCVSAAIGQGNNNTGELFAICLVLEFIRNTNLTGSMTIFTDSKIAQGALTRGWNAGRENANLLAAARKVRSLINCTVNIVWIPGHSDIAQNVLADSLAGAGSAYSADRIVSTDSYTSAINSGSFSNLSINTELQGASFNCTSYFNGINQSLNSDFLVH